MHPQQATVKYVWLNIINIIHPRIPSRLNVAIKESDVHVNQSCSDCKGHGHACFAAHAANETMKSHIKSVVNKMQSEATFEQLI